MSLAMYVLMCADLTGKVGFPGMWRDMFGSECCACDVYVNEYVHVKVKAGVLGSNYLIGRGRRCELFDLCLPCLGAAWLFVVLYVLSRQ